MIQIHQTHTSHLFEGFVFEDSSGFMFKYKLPFYRYWKQWRKHLRDLIPGHILSPVFKSKMDVDVYGVLKEMKEKIESKEEAEKVTIIDVEKEYYKDLQPIDVD